MVSTRVEQLQKMLLETPNDSFLIYALALEWIKQNKINEALEAFEKLTINAPDYLATYLFYGNLLTEVNQPIKASEMYNKGIQVAKSQKNNKAAQELNQALLFLDDMD
jgi:tetratricopeptide (TPR) repeat protein